MIQRSDGLSEEESAAEEEFASAIESDIDGHLSEYEKRFGKIINTDSAKLLYQPYADDPILRVKFSRATYGPAKWLMNELFERRVRSQEVTQILFMAGGTAAGKSSCAESLGTILRDADLIVDGTMSNQVLSEKQIGTALFNRQRCRRGIYLLRRGHCLGAGGFEVAQDQSDPQSDVFAGSHFFCRKTMVHLLQKFGMSRTSN